MSVQIQRYLTVDSITKRRLNAETIWLKPESALAGAGDCIPNDWGDESDERNMAIRLADGFIELQIKSPDDVWIKEFFRAFPDVRYAYGVHDRISSIIFKIDNPATIDRWTDLWPRGHRDKAGSWVSTSFVHSLPETKVAKPVWRHSSPLPGSRFAGGLVVWRPNGKPEAEDPELGLEDLELRPIGATSMEAIVRAIAFATLSYWINVYLDGLEDWDETLTRSIGGWIARLVREGRDINARGKSLEGVCWAPIDSSTNAGDLIQFLSKKADLSAAFESAESQLERNPQAPVPGWGSIETLFGVPARVGLRRAFKAGLDIDALERMSERYFLDLSENIYLDRDALLKGLPFKYEQAVLLARHEKDDQLWVSEKKSYNPFKIYTGSKLRADVDRQDFFPSQEPAAVLRYSRVHKLVTGDDRYSDEYLILNTFRGFTIKPIATIDEAIMRPIITMLDRVLALLTQENDGQMMWLKKFIADIVKNPERKPQVCPIIVGGQGIGKSVLGESVMEALIDEMAGSANASDLDKNRFVIEPFIGKLVTFIDEVKLESVEAINNIKKLIRSTRLSGQEKYEHQRDHYIPSRLLIATNSPDIGLTPADAVDRAFFFIMSWTAENKRMTEREFAQWVFKLKPFYNEFLAALKIVSVRQHLMRYFVDIPVERAELEDLSYSSRDDESIVRSTMSGARRVARRMVEEAHIIWGSDITAWFTELNLRDAIKRIDGARSRVEAYQVMLEFERAEVIETMRGGYRRFKWGYGKLLESFGKAHGLDIPQLWDYQPGDFDDNDVRGIVGAPAWRGLKHGQPKEEPQRRPFDPDAMEPY